MVDRAEEMMTFFDGSFPARQAKGRDDTLAVGAPMPAETDRKRDSPSFWL
jgi:hypothetical protein